MPPKSPHFEGLVPRVALLVKPVGSGASRRKLGHWGHGPEGAIRTSLFLCLFWLPGYHEVNRPFATCSCHDIPWSILLPQAQTNKATMDWNLQYCESKETFPLLKLILSGILSVMESWWTPFSRNSPSNLVSHTKHQTINFKVSLHINCSTVWLLPF